MAWKIFDFLLVLLAGFLMVEGVPVDPVPPDEPTSPYHLRKNSDTWPDMILKSVMVPVI